MKCPRVDNSEKKEYRWQNGKEMFSLTCVLFIQLNDEGMLLYGQKVPKGVITNAEEQMRIIEAEHIDHTTGRILLS